MHSQYLIPSTGETKKSQTKSTDFECYSLGGIDDKVQLIIRPIHTEKANYEVHGTYLYRINNLVDVGNILSIECKRSVAVLDYEKIKGDVKVRLGKSTDIYEGIGRGIINIENIPLYEDSIGPFGSTTSDTIRTSVTKDTKKILLFVVCFGKDNIEENKQMAIDLYTNYCHARNITFVDVKKE